MERACTLHTDGGIWQVSTFAFEDTQNDEAYSRLARKYKDNNKKKKFQCIMKLYKRDDAKIIRF